MSLFRKPKRIQRRVFCVDDDDDGEPEPPPPPVISHGRKENKPVKITPLLSFADEEEDGEVFIVKKSSQSKRLAKRRDKEKRRAHDIDSNKNENHANEMRGVMRPLRPRRTLERVERVGRCPAGPAAGAVAGTAVKLETSLSHVRKEKESSKQEKPKPKKKKVTLEGLILSGREALAADGAGDVSGSDEEDAEDNRGFHRYRADTVRAALAGAPGHIPDAALIHAARKTRQQAREHGEVAPASAEAAGGRLARDDGSGDDEDEGRLHVRGLHLPTDKPQRGTAAAPADAELDSEGEEWAAQQMHKARGVGADAEPGAGELNPFAAPPPPPLSLEEPPVHLRPLAAPARPLPDTPAALLDALATRLNELEAESAGTRARREWCRERRAAAGRARAERAARRGALDAAYRRAQAARGFLTDLIECLDEKMPQLEALERRALALYRRRGTFLAARRRADVQDQALDTLAALAAAGRGGAAKGPESEEKVRRTAEREGRRRARRLRREAAAAPGAHRDGDSSDDELPPAELHHYTHEKEAIRAASAGLFADALPAWRSARGVCARLARWRRRDPMLYADAYVADYLPKLLAPYVRHQLILWNPLADEDNEDYERMDWYSCLMMYGVREEKLSSESSGSEDEGGAAGPAGAAGEALTEAAVRADPDLMLVPAILRGVVLPKLTEVVECAWDPVCVRAGVRLRQLVLRAGALPGGAAAAARLAAAARARLAQALAADVFLPPLPTNQAMEGASGAFWRRCLGAGVRLLRAALALTAPPPLLRADGFALALIDTLSTAAGAAPGRAAAAAAAALAETLPRGGGGGALRERALARLAVLAQRALSDLDQANPLHMKAVEQAKAVIAEARAAE